MFTTIRVSESERGLLFRGGRFDRVLPPGTHTVWAFAGRVRAHLVSVLTPELDARDAQFAIVAAAASAEAAALFAIVTCGPEHAAAVFADGMPAALVRPGTRRVFCRATGTIEVETIDLRATLAVDPRHLALALNQVPKAVVQVVVHSYEAALVFDDGALHQVLHGGAPAYWTLLRTVEVCKVDLRTQAAEVSAQELLTRDRVTVRITLTCFHRITDPAALMAATADHAAVLHRLVQFAIRGAIGSRSLDEALDDRGALDAELLAAVRAGLDVPGLVVDSVNMRDLILPGDMRGILNRVVEAEKAAQANLIRRREETAATRSALNTARLMDENPTLLRLKELETLERLMEKVGHIDLHTGAEGLDAMLTGLLRPRMGLAALPGPGPGDEASPG